MKISRSFVIAALSLALGGPVLAGESDRVAADNRPVASQAGGQTGDQAPAGASAEVKAAKGVENREPVEEGTSFAAGDKVWVWSRITGAKDTTVRHVWNKDGKEVWGVNLAVKGNRWTTHSRRTVQPGQYEVVVQAQDGSTLGSVTFTVQ